MHAGRDDMTKKLDQFEIYQEVHTFPAAPHTFRLFTPRLEPALNHTVAVLNKVFGQQKINLPTGKRK